MAYFPDKDAPNAARRRQVDAQAQMSQYETDRRSAFMSNLPMDVTESEIINMACGPSRILSVRLLQKRKLLSWHHVCPWFIC